jgi:hypothetical protein
VAQLVGVDNRKQSAAGEDHVERHQVAAEWSQLGDRFPGAGDREPFAFGGSIDHIAAVVAEFPDRDLRHAQSVSRVNTSNGVLPTTPIAESGAEARTSPNQADLHVLRYRWMMVVTAGKDGECIRRPGGQCNWCGGTVLGVRGFG